jgi:UDP-hydrolysing UDP-N-acetyl-D-glucosamine 2-epimerase
MNTKRKIAVVITARPSYSRVKTALQAIKNHPSLELQLIIASSALLDRYGSAVNYIENDGFEIAAKVFNVLEGENLTAAAKTTGIGILELSTVFDNLKPDIVVTIADRFETMATAISAAYLNIPLAHIQGGEVTGNIDEKVRHAITKLSDYHFVASEDAQQRLIRLGENPELVFNTGCPSIDLAEKVLENPTLDFNPYEKYGGVGNKPSLDNGYIVVLQHPVTNEYNENKMHIWETLNAMNSIELPILWFWPNLDAGANSTSNGIRKFREINSPKFIHFFKNFECVDFLKLLVNSKCLVGNSSVGLRECSFLGVPAVNIGTRQHGRLRGLNVIDVNYDSNEIIQAVTSFLNLKVGFKSNLFFGRGDAGVQIANKLAEVTLQFHKTITY